MTAPDRAWANVHRRWAETVRNALQVADDPSVVTLRMVVAPLIADVDRVLDLELDDDEREALISRASRRLSLTVEDTVRDVMADYLAIPAPEPIDIPIRGTWLRERYVGGPSARSRRPDTGPEWCGKWHAADGTIIHGDVRQQHVDASTLCGRKVALRSQHLWDGETIREAAIADAKPGVEVCGHCDRLVSRS